MKCAIHTDQDAIGICHSCGAGVCHQCSQRIGGIFYCLSCLDAGRYRPPLSKGPRGGTQQVPPGYLTPSTRQVFIVGIIAMAFLIVGFYVFFYYPIWAPYYSYFTPFRIWALILIALGITLTGITFFGFYRYYDSFFALSVSLFSLLSGWPMVLSDLLLYNPNVLMPGTYSWEFSPGPLFPLYLFASLTGLLLWGLTFIIWAIVFLRTRHFLPGSTLIIVAACFWLILGHFYLAQMPFFPLFVGSPYTIYAYNMLFTMFLIFAAEPAALASAVLFYRIRK
ncbi:MAG: hypothetical protein ACFFCF_05085 [Promethearchaeota archaeon]